MKGISYWIEKRAMITPERIALVDEETEAYVFGNE